MSGVAKSLAVLEYLADYPEGVPLVQIATELKQVLAGCDRTLKELIRSGYVRQLPPGGKYVLAFKLAAIGLNFLDKSGAADVAQPVLARLARLTGELVLVAVVEGERLILRSKEQGARSGLLYDTDLGVDICLSCSAAGHAWLMTLSGEHATQCVVRQGIGQPEHYGPNAPTSVQAVLELLDGHRRRGYSIVQEGYAAGVSSIAAPVRRPGMAATGVLAVTGPSSRLPLQRMQQLGAAVAQAADELGRLAGASALLSPATSAR